MNIIQQQDIAEFVRSFALADELRGCRILITGGTGHVGSSLIHCLLALHRDIRIVAPVRRAEKARILFSESELMHIHLLEGDMENCDYEQGGPVDFIVHGAAPTDNRYFVSHPVETYSAICNGTQRLLEFARRHPVRGFVFLSSLEVYGVIHDDSHPLTEEQLGSMDITSARSSYSMGKRAAETLCCLYAAEYGVPARIARLPQTMGAGVSPEDNRVIAQFCRLTAEGRDIVIHTTGESGRTFCYVTDAVSALLYLLLRGRDAEAYNVASEANYISVRDMAYTLREQFNPGMAVRIELKEGMPYPPVSRLWLASQKIEALGWRARYDLPRIFARLVEYYRSCKS